MTAGLEAGVNETNHNRLALIHEYLIKAMQSEQAECQEILVEMCELLEQIIESV